MVAARAKVARDPAVIGIQDRHLRWGATAQTGVPQGYGAEIKMIEEQLNCVSEVRMLHDGDAKGEAPGNEREV